MVLSFEQITPLIRGTDHIEEKDGRLLLRRCTDAQTAVYAETGFDSKCRCTAGVRLDFITDSRTLSFDYFVTGRLSIPWMSIDLYADGVMVCTDFKETSHSFDHYTFSYTFETAKSRRLTVYLPYMLDLRISSLSLDDGAAFSPYADYAGRMLCFGDSITHGYHAKYSSLTYPATVARYFNFDWNNQGNAGYIFNADTIDPAQNFAPDLITVAFGTNDWNKLSSPEQFHDNAAAFFDRLGEAYPGIPVVGILPLWREDQWRPKKVGSFEAARACLREIMTAHGCVIVDGMDAVPHVPAFFHDARLHPNDLGFAFYSLALIRAISDLRA